MKTPRCKEIIADQGGFHWYNCKRKLLPGRDTCAIHTDEAKAARKAKSKERFDARLNRDMAPFRAVERLTQDNAILRAALDVARKFIVDMQNGTYHVPADKVAAEIDVLLASLAKEGK